MMQVKRGSVSYHLKFGGPIFFFGGEGARASVDWLPPQRTPIPVGDGTCKPGSNLGPFVAAWATL